MPRPEPVVLTLTPGARPLGDRIAELLGGVHHSRGADIPVARRVEDVTRHIAMLFEAGHPVIGLCAAGILIRATAAVQRDKWQEPSCPPDCGTDRWICGNHHRW